MVAPRIRCIVVELPAMSEAVERRIRPPARELLPWADPYIAGLIRKLQDEVRAERAGRRAVAADAMAMDAVYPESATRCEAPLPTGSSTIEFEVPEDGDWPLLRE